MGKCGTLPVTCSIWDLLWPFAEAAPVAAGEGAMELAGVPAPHSTHHQPPITFPSCLNLLPPTRSPAKLVLVATVGSQHPSGRAVCLSGCQPAQAGPQGGLNPSQHSGLVSWGSAARALALCPVPALGLRLGRVANGLKPRTDA